MKALRYHGPRDIRYEQVADPVLRDAGDVLVKMEKCAICGSDLHIYHGELRSSRPHFCVGHEAVGEVMEVGRAVSRVRPGDKVMISGAVSCGACRQCLSGNILCCETTRGRHRVFGIGQELEGCQAEAIVVPAGDFNAVPVPEGVSTTQALLLTDNLPTAHLACRNAGISAGKSVAVVGLGPIGLMAVEIALAYGASRVYAIDLVPERRAMAARLGAIALDAASAVEEVRDGTQGRMVDCVVEAVGAHASITAALALAAYGGTVSVIGLNTARTFEFPLYSAFNRGLTFRISICSVQPEWPVLIPMLQAGRLHPEQFVSHEMPLSEGAQAYRMYDRREDGVLKMVLTP